MRTARWKCLRDKKEDRKGMNTRGAPEGMTIESYVPMTEYYDWAAAADLVGQLEPEEPEVENETSCIPRRIPWGRRP